jgi:hypothetical protein
MSRILAALCLVVFGAAADQRAEAIRHATVWMPVDVKSMNLKAGPPGPQAFAPGATVTCTYFEKDHGQGSTPKFHCLMPTGPVGRELKVRYGKTNGEVYAQVAATRLLWALGFPANRMYPAKVACRGCSADPFTTRPAPDATAPILFDPATIDEDYPGTTVENSSDEGWAWKELDQVDPKAGGASVAERDALKLLAAFIQHTSNKSINQRIVCADPPACSKSVMMIADLGKTFGRANSGNDDLVGAVNFQEWSHVPVWKGAVVCVANLHWTWSGSLADPLISEAGRAFLANLLNQLTDAQLTDLFTVARFTDRDPTATVAQWVEAFKAKRAEITNRKCAS